jgi:kynurenine formamidase
MSDQETLKISEAEVLTYFESLSNWGRWGDDDERGTLNLVGPAEVAAAARLIESGAQVSCSRPLSPRPITQPGTEFLHKMQASGEGAAKTGRAVATDWFALGCHGFDHTHIDSLAHMFWNRQMYNGRDSSLCTTSRGALAGGLEAAFGGILGRGLLVDGPALRGKRWLEPGEALHPEDLDAWLDRCGLVTRPGDFLWVRTGRGAWEAAGQAYDLRADGTPGLHASCLPWLREHDVAVLLSDVANDVRPSGYDFGDPVHLVGIVSMGLWLVDNAMLESLSRTAAGQDRYEFFSVIAPLALRRSTGSPVNPIAVF